MEYTRKVGTEAASAGGPAERTMSFGTVTLREQSGGGQSKDSNVAELLLVRGLATVVRGNRTQCPFLHVTNRTEFVLLSAACRPRRTVPRREGRL
jgi:hypothetical protein